MAKEVSVFGSLGNAIKANASTIETIALGLNEVALNGAFNAHAATTETLAELYETYEKRGDNDDNYTPPSIDDLDVFRGKVIQKMRNAAFKR